MATIFSQVMDRLAMMDPAYRAEKRADSRLEREYTLRGGELNQRAGIDTAATKLRTDEALRLDEAGRQQAHTAKRDALVHTKIGQPSPITGAPMEPAEAFQRAESELAELEAQQALTEPMAGSQAKTARSLLALEQDQKSLPWVGDNAVTALQADTTKNLVDIEEQKNRDLRIGAERPTIESLSRLKAAEQGAVSQANTAVAGNKQAEQEAIKEFVPLTAFNEAQGGLFNSQFSNSVGQLKRKQQAAIDEQDVAASQNAMFKESPELKQSGAYGAMIRAQARIQEAQMKADAEKAAADRLRGLTNHDVNSTQAVFERWAAERAARGTNATPAAVTLEQPQAVARPSLLDGASVDPAMRRLFDRLAPANR